MDLAGGRVNQGGSFLGSFEDESIHFSIWGQK